MVRSEITTSWERALARAEARNLQARSVGGDTRSGATVTWYRVGSWSRTGLEHGVKITVDGNGVQVVCSCEGGLNNRPCQHAVALKAAGWLGAQPAPAITPEEITRIKGRRSIASLNHNDEELAEIDQKLAFYGAA